MPPRQWLHDHRAAQAASQWALAVPLIPSMKILAVIDAINVGCIDHKPINTMINAVQWATDGAIDAIDAINGWYFRCGPGTRS